MGPDALRTAGLADALSLAGLDISDSGNLSSETTTQHDVVVQTVPVLEDTAYWISTVSEAAYQAAKSADTTLVLGGDHSITAGTLQAHARYSKEIGQPFFVLWLSAHTDLHSTSPSTAGKLHGTPLAYAICESGPWIDLPTPVARVEPQNICMLGIRSLDFTESEKIEALNIDAHPMSTISEEGISAPLMNFLDRVKSMGGRLHVCFDVGFLDPSLAIATGTPVQGGPTYFEALQIMRILNSYEVVNSVDVLELNPSMDNQSETATLIVELVGILMQSTNSDQQPLGRNAA